MKFRGCTPFGGVTYYKLIGSVFAGSPALPGDAQLEGGGNGRRDGLLSQAARLTTLSTQLQRGPTHDREDSPSSTPAPAERPEPES